MPKPSSGRRFPKFSSVLFYIGYLLLFPFALAWLGLRLLFDWLWLRAHRERPAVQVNAP